MLSPDLIGTEIAIQHRHWVTGTILTICPKCPDLNGFKPIYAGSITATVRRKVGQWDTTQC
jgi:hypothetical protein